MLGCAPQTSVSTGAGHGRFFEFPHWILQNSLLTQIAGLIFSVPLRWYVLLFSVVHVNEKKQAKHDVKNMIYPVLIQAYVSSALCTETDKTKGLRKTGG